MSKKTIDTIYVKKSLQDKAITMSKHDFLGTNLLRVCQTSGDIFVTFRKKIHGLKSLCC